MAVPWNQRSDTRHSTSSSGTYKTEPYPSTSETHWAPPAKNALEYESRKKEYTCLFLGCTQKPFGRSADLDRHYKQVHLQDSEKDSYLCDYKKCERSGRTRDGQPTTTAFHRKDHFRDHLRDFHKEDIPKRGAKDSGSAWLADRWIEPKWWRCSKCLMRIRVAAHGWECPECKVFCERDRQLVRGGP